LWRHDSSASLPPHLASRKALLTIVSTGAWLIPMAVGLGATELNAAGDTLANVDVEGTPIARARFMGGRECSEIAGAFEGRSRQLGLGQSPCVKRQSFAAPCRTWRAVCFASE
jgi:hypothetical protein